MLSRNSGHMSRGCLHAPHSSSRVSSGKEGLDAGPGGAQESPSAGGLSQRTSARAEKELALARNEASKSTVRA